MGGSGFVWMSLIGIGLMGLGTFVSTDLGMMGVVLLAVSALGSLGIGDAYRRRVYRQR